MGVEVTGGVGVVSLVLLPCTVGDSPVADLWGCAREREGVEVTVLGSPSLIIRMVSVDVKQHCI